jgi:mannosyltransferase
MMRRILFSGINWAREHPLPMLLLLAMIIRCINLDSRSLQYDDVFSIFLSGRSLGEIVQGTAADTMPPFYYFLLHFWMRIGASAWFLRGLSVLFSLIAIRLLAELVRELFDEKTALWAAFLAAISPFQFYHAQDVRNYALLCCEQLAMVLFFARIWKANERGHCSPWWEWAGLILSGTASMYTHNVAVLALGIPDGFLVLMAVFGRKTNLRRRFKLLGRLIAAQGFIALLNLPWLLLLPSQFAKVQRAWSLSIPGLVEVIQVPVMWITGLPLPGIWLTVGVLVSLEVLVVVVMQLARGWKKESGIAFLVTFTLVLPALFFGLSYVIKPIFVARGFILASMTFCGAAGWAVQAGWKQGIGKILLAGFIAAALIGLPAQASYADFPRSPYREAAADLVKKVQPGEVVVHDNKLSYFPFRFYEPELREVFLADIPGSGNDTFAPASQQAMAIFPEENIQSAAGDSRIVYFVVFSNAIAEYKAIGEKNHPALEWLNAHYALKARTVYRDLEVYTYERP